MQSLVLKFRTVGFDIFRLISRFGIAVDTTTSQRVAVFLMRHAGDAMWTRNNQLVLRSFSRHVIHTMHLRNSCG